MKIIRNEKGYTLILTLIIIIVIASLFSTFAFASITQQKQVEITDDTYEVTAIAEMGVEYYQAKVLNAIETARRDTLEKITKFEEIDKPSEIQIDQLDTDIKNVMLDLKNSIEDYYLSSDIATAEKVVDPYNNKFFGLYSTPKFDQQGLLVMGVKGVIHEAGEKKQEKKIFVKFKFPDSLINFDFEDGNGGEDGEIENPPAFTPLLSLPNFNNSYPNPFPPENIKVCSDNVTSERCKTDKLPILDNLSHNTVYYTVNTPEKIGKGHKYNITNLFVNGNLSTNYLKDISNFSFLVNGKLDIDGIPSSSNVYLHSTSDTNFHGNFLTNNSEAFIEGNGSFQYFVISSSNVYTTKTATIDGQATIQNNSNLQINSDLTFNDSSVIKYSNIQTIGKFTIQTVDVSHAQIEVLRTAYFNKFTKLTNSQLEILGEAFFNELQAFGSTINISNETTFSSNWIKFSDTKANFNNKVQSNTSQTEIVIENNSKVCFKDLSSNIKLNISRNSNVYIPDTLKNQNNSLDWAPGKPIYVTASEYKIVCPSSSSGNSEVIGKDDIIDPIDDNNFLDYVEYQKKE